MTKIRKKNQSEKIMSYLSDKDLYGIRDGSDLLKDYLLDNPEETMDKSTFYKVYNKLKDGKDILDPIYEVLRIQVPLKIKLKMLKDLVDDINSKL